LLASCIEFFGYTYAMMRPRLIIALGTGPAAFLSHVCPRELNTWRKYGMRHLDDLPMASIHFQNQAAICVAITHPSMPIAWLRRPPYQYDTGEIRLLVEARLESERISE
jgi:uracil-DNA glycosylase